MTNVSLDRKVNRRRVKFLCRSRAADSPAVLRTRVLRNRLSLAHRTIWVSRANGLRELRDVLMVCLLAHQRSLFPRDPALFFVAEAFFLCAFNGARFDEQALTLVPLAGTAEPHDHCGQDRILPTAPRQRSIDPLKKHQMVQIRAFETKRLSLLHP